VNKEYDVIYDNVTKPEASYNIKFKLSDLDKDGDIIDLSLRMLLVTNFSKMSEFNLELKNKNIINNNIGFSSGKYLDYGIITVGASTDKEEEFLKEIKNKFNNLDLSEESFNLIKKTLIANVVYSFTTTDGIMNYLLSDYFDKKTIDEESFVKLKEFSYKKYIEVINKIDFSNVNITIMKPLDERK